MQQFEEILNDERIFSLPIVEYLNDLLMPLAETIKVEESGGFWLTDPSSLDPSSLRDMSGQVLRVKGYYDVMIHKHHCEDVYDILLFFYKHFWGLKSIMT